MKPILLTLIGALAVGFLLCLPARGQSAQDLLQQGVRLEQVQGDYEGAIALYRRIAADQSADRRLVAQALIQLGKAYESLGRTEAFSAYDRVAREFSDQSDLVAEARVRMRGLAPAAVSDEKDPNVIKFTLPSDWDQDSPVVSNSGRLVARRGETGGLELLDIETGGVRKVEVADMGCAEGYFSPSVFSPDDSKVAVQCSHYRDQFTSWGAGVVDLRTGQASEVVSAEEYFETTDEPGKHLSIAVPLGWSADGKSLLVKLWNVTEWSGGAWARQTMDVGIFPIDGGPPTIVSHVDDSPNSDPFLYGGCLMRNDTVLLTQYSAGTWTQSRGQIRSMMLSTGTERLTRDSEDFSFQLFGCDRKSGLVYFGQKPLSWSDRRSLWVAEVTEDGEFGNQRMVQGIPADALSLSSKGGSVIYLDARDESIGGVFSIDMDPESGLMVGEPEMIEEMTSGNGRPEIISSDGKQLLWKHWPAPIDPKMPKLFVRENDGPFKPVGPSFGNHASLAIQGDEYVYADSIGTYVANWRTGAREESLANRLYAAASADLRFLYRVDGHDGRTGRDAEMTFMPNDGPKCVHRLDRLSGAEDEAFCWRGRAGVARLGVDPVSGRLAVMHNADAGSFLLEVYDPSSGSAEVVLQEDKAIMFSWAGGRLYTKTASPLAFSRIDPASGNRQALDLHRIQETVTLGSPTFGFLVSPDEREMFFLGYASSRDYERNLVVIKDPLAAK